MAAKPTCKRTKREGWGAEKEFHRDRKGGKGHTLCRMVGGDRGHSKNSTAREGKEERKLFGSKSQP